MHKNLFDRVLIVIALFLSGALGFSLSLYLHRDNHFVSHSTDVKLMQTFHYPALFVKQLEGDPNAGEKIFKEFCATCHGKPPLIDIKAPRIGDKKIWQALLQAQGMSTLLNMTIKGFGAMPARGGCFECSDEQLRGAIEYMIGVRPYHSPTSQNFS